MKGIALCSKGIEDIASQEIEELIGKKSEILDGMVIFDIESNEELCKLSYLGRTISKVLLLIEKINFKDEEDLLQKAEKISFKEWLSEKKTFKVDSERIESDINLEYINGELGKVIIEGIKEYKQKVNLEMPNVVIFLLINSKTAYFGIDFSGKDLSKRSYRIFSASRNIKSTIAYAAVRISNYSKNEILLDPFCLSGTIAIEAALYGCNRSPWYYEKDEFQFVKFSEFDFAAIDKKFKEDCAKIYCVDSMFKNVDMAKKNAKIAGINKVMQFSRIEIDWLELKIAEKSVDKIVCCPPNISKTSNEKDIKRLYKEFFNQADFVLKEKCLLVCCTKNPDELDDEAKEYFTQVHRREVYQGEEMFYIVKWKRK